MVQQLNGIYNGYDLDGDGSPVNELQEFSFKLEGLKAEIVTAVIDGAGSIPGLETLTGLDADADDVNPDPAIVKQLKILLKNMYLKGCKNLLIKLPTDPENKTIDDIFKESIEDTIHELESYDPDIFSGT